MKLTISIKNQCSSRCDNGGYLLKDNYLGEFLTEILKKKARDNLGISDPEEVVLNYRIVENFSLMNELEDLQEGTLCYVKQDIEDKHYYVYKNGTWEFANIGTTQLHTGIPIYTLDMIDNEVDDLPDKYILIRSDSDLEGEVTEKVYKTTTNGNYVDILFSALRALLSEVAKLKNSFIYGINSYNNEDTALSVVLDGFTEIDEEPLWAVEESDLSEVFALETAQLLTPSDNIDITNDIFKISGTSYWEDNLSITPNDPKLVLYFTTNNLNILLSLNGIDIDFNTLNIPKCQTYNIMVIISRQMRNKGDNYIWISVDNYTLDLKLIEGYYNGESILDAKITLDKAYSIKRVSFTDMTLSKFKLYSKAQDFSDSVIPSKPSEQDYKYNVAHLTIRSVNNYDVLHSILSLLLNNELVYVEKSTSNFKSGLYIKSNDKIISLSGTIINPDNPPIPDDTMDKEELIKLLQEMGIVYNDDTLSLSNIGDITFIHEDSGNTYKVSIDAYGNLVSSKIPESTLQDRIENSFALMSESTRGFVGQLGLAEYKQEVNNSATITTDLKLYSDRIKIGAFYAPRSTNTVYGCSHAYIELENTSNKDFNLEGCYLHYVHPYNALYNVEHLALKGVIPAGGTFLIRGKYYSNDINTFIKVDSYDLEWYINKELIDLSYDADGAYGFALTYGNPELKYDDVLVISNDGPLTGTTTSKDPYLYDPSYIDSVYFNHAVLNSSKSNYWTGPNTCMACSVDAIFKNSFELDPAKQAFQALTMRDSSRVRNKTASDFYYIPLSKEFIEFPKSKDVYPVSRFTPKASYLKKNVCTDKSKMDLEKPNMVTCSFGIDTKSTRCFNWISAGLFDEYIWIKKYNTEDNYVRFESYKHIEENVPLQSGRFFRKEFSPEINNTIYARITSRFPADNTLFTAHKCIIQSTELATTEPVVYTYIVGRADKNGNPDPEHTSEEYTFTLYPESWNPRIYQTTDLQGFHWVEYQVWNAAANLLLEQITNDFKASPNFIPVLVNTGDMTLSGARINEWLDYYNAGKNLFKHLELMNVVGNNDLCGTIPTELGTGDDLGKSNSYYFHLFYCYEVNPDIPPIINNKYVPSLYYIDFDDYRLLFVNSEITYENCNSWFNLKLNDGVVNAYTGWRVPCIPNSDKEAFKQLNYSKEFTPIYNMLYQMTETNKLIIALCHEMPFTVITAENLISSTKNVSRSLSGSSLVGSHLNQLNSTDTQSNYWFSRLLEYRHVRLCLGGHKHTYAVTYPLREYYFYGDNKNSKDDGPMAMQPTLENDFTTFEKDGLNYSKFPLMLVDKGQPTDENNIFPYTYTENFVANSDVNHQDGVIYFMCQASGYKLFSNKELPSVNQKFSQFLPKSTIKNGSYSASSDLRSPMYAIIDLDGNYEITLIKLLNIQKTPTTLLTPLAYGTSDIEILSLRNVNSDPSATSDEKLYGKWVSGIDTLMVVV